MEKGSKPIRRERGKRRDAIGQKKVRRRMILGEKEELGDGDGKEKEKGRNGKGRKEGMIWGWKGKERGKA